MEQDNRRQRVHRIRMAQNYEKSERMDKMHDVHKKIELMEELREYVSIRHQRIWKDEHLHLDEWKEKHPSVLHLSPGPGAYFN